MRGEQSATLIGVVQMLRRRPGDGEAVEGGGAAPDLIQDHEGAFAGLPQDGGGLDHLRHEGRAPAR